MRQKYLLTGLTVLVVGIWIGLVVASTAIEYVRFSEELEEELQQKANEVSYAVSYSLWNGNLNNVARVAESEVLADHVRFIEVKDNQEQTQLAVEQQSDDTAAKMSIVPNCSSCMLKTSQIEHEGEILGRVYVYSHPNERFAHTSQFGLTAMVIVGMATLLFYILIVYTFNLRYRELDATKRNIELERTFRQLEQKNQELESLTTKLENTTQRLKAKNQDLEQLNTLTIGRELKMIELKQKLAEAEQIAELTQAQHIRHDHAQQETKDTGVDQDSEKSGSNS